MFIFRNLVHLLFSAWLAIGDVVIVRTVHKKSYESLYLKTNILLGIVLDKIFSKI